jgi:hypothetical protein
MPRPERPLDPTAGPVQEFAAALRAVRERAGAPKYLQMARATGRSRTALAEAAGGDHLPTWETVEAYLSACGEDPDPWLPRWERLQDDLRERRRPAPAPPPQHAPPVPPDPAARPASPTVGALPTVGPPPVPPADRSAGREPLVPVVVPPLTRARMLVLAGVLTMAAIVSGSATATLLVVSMDDQVAPAAAPSPGSARILDVDSMPVSLSTRPVAGCERDPDCRVPGVELWKGDEVGVFCTAFGDVMRGWAVAFEGPLRENDFRNQQSNRWYGAMVDGRFGYLPEVYLTPEYRGGLQLGPCSPSRSLEPR